MKKYLIKKRNRGYWKKNNLGYSDDIADAKEFTKEEAEMIILNINSDKTMHEI